MKNWFGIGIYRSKSSDNVGTLWRSAYQLGASFIFTIEKRYKKEVTDTLKASKNIPLLHFDTIEDARKSLSEPDFVFVDYNKEGNTKDLVTFKHPKHAIYILGAEDFGFNGWDKSKRTCFLSIPSVRTPSYNVAMAGSIILYDRYSKSLNIK